MYYILDGHTPALVDLLTWAQWFETASRGVAHTTVGNACVSTVFLGIDHNWSGAGPPLLFETMVHGGTLDGECERYSTWDEAERGHNEAVEKVKAA